MQFRFCSLFLVFGVTLFAMIPGARLFAQDGPEGSVPDDPSTAMTIESGDPIDDSGEASNNEDVAADPNYTQPQGPYSPDLPDTGGNYEGPIGVTGIFNGNVATGCSYDPLSHSAHRVIDDIVVPGSIGKYPLKMTRYYNSRQQYYATPGAIGLSPGWAHEYSWLLWGNGTKVVSPHGNVYDPYCGPPLGVSEGWDGNGIWRLADGGKVVFSGGHVTDIYDPYGQRTRIAYDANGQRVKVTEPGGRCLWFTYSDQDQDGTKLLTWVEAFDVDGSPGTPTHPTGQRTDWVNYTYTACDPINPPIQQRKKKMLTGVNYSDGRSASYKYRTDNVTEGPTTHKQYPLLKRCDDVRYNGPMGTIWYEYQNAGPHGAIINEKYPGIGAVSAISPGVPTGGQGTQDTFTETRGDGPTRTFNYTHMQHCQGNECGPCSDYQENIPPQQMLTDYTDFQGRTTHLGYDANWYINSVRDANNHTTTYTRGPVPPAGIGQITRISHPDGTHVDYTYYNEGTGHIGGHYIYTVTDERGGVTTYTRDANYRVTRIDYPSNQWTPASHEEFVYNGFGQVTRHRLKNGNYVHYQYDGRGLLLYKWNPTTNSTAQPGDPKITYMNHALWCWADRVWKEILPANAQNQVAYEIYEYDRNASGQACPGRGLVTKVTHADGKYRSASYSQFGNKMWEENELRQRTTYSYDNYNRVLSITKPGIGAETFSYLKPSTNSPYLHTTNSIYTDTSRAGIVTTNVYNPNWLKTATTVAGTTTSFDYDNVGNLTWVTEPLNRKTHNTYDNRNRKTSATEAYGTNVAATTVWHYDGVSNINRVDRPDGIHETKGIDALNRVLWTVVPQSATVDLPTWFGYNPSGTIQWVKDSNLHVTTFDYDASDQKTKMTYPGSSYQSWAYDNAHNLKSRTTVHGETQSFTYDNRNRKTGMSWSNGVDSASYGYDDADRLTAAGNANAAVTRAYDAAGRMYWERQNTAGLGIKDVRYEYDADGKETRMYVDGAAHDYTFGYDALGRFEKISPTGGGVAFQYYYDGASNEIQRMNFLNGGVLQYYSRDSLNRMSHRYVKKGQNYISLEVYTYDRLNRLTEVDRADDGKKDLFGYYWNGELLWCEYGVNPDSPIQEGGDPDMDTTDNVDPFADYQPPETVEAEPPPPSGTTSTPPPTQMQFPDTAQFGRGVAYYLDLGGNRTSVYDTLTGNSTPYTPNNLNQYTGSAGGAAITNGSEHEVATYNTVTYSYINDEHLKQASTGTNNYYLYYDALGRCVKRKLNNTTTYYVYDGEKSILEYNGGGALYARNLYGKGIDEILARLDVTVNAGQWFYYQQDHEGSVTHLTNASGNVLEKYKYDAFGAPSVYGPDFGWTPLSATAYNNRFLFTGREYAASYLGTYIPAFNFYEYRARAYNPTLGRFMSEDPKLFATGDYNLFRYCHNDPLDMTDPMGTDGIPNGDGTYHFVLRSDVVVPNIIGEYVINKSNGTARQCAGAGQFLTGTRLADGTLHDAPPARHSGWTQGAPVTKDTPNGTLVARRWENGVYPNKDIREYNAEAVKKDPSIINHTGIKVGWENGKAIILDQWKGESGSLQKRSYDPKEGDWSVVNATKPYDPQPSASDFSLDQAIKKGIQEAQDAASDVIHTKPHEQRQ
jgi:RHS repeat-associated protein